MQRNTTIDLFRFLLSLSILCIHAQLFKDMSFTLHTVFTSGLFRLGVPVFFLITGFFSYRKITEGKTLADYIRHYAMIYFSIAGILALFSIVFALFAHNYARIPMILLRIFTTSEMSAYWYFPSMIFSLLLLQPLWKKGKILPGLIIGLLLYLLALPNDSYAGLLQISFLQPFYSFHKQLFTWPQAGLMSSLLYLSLGAWTYEHQDAIKRTPLLVLLALALLIAEAWFTHSHGGTDANCYLSLLYAAPVLFLFLLDHPIRTALNTSLLAKMSFYNYLLHVPLNNLGYALGSNTVMRVLITAVPTLALSYLLARRK